MGTAMTHANVIRVVSICAVNDGRDQAAPRMQCDASLGLVMHAALPAVDRPDLVDDVPTCGQMVVDQLAGEGHDPFLAGAV